MSTKGNDQLESIDPTQLAAVTGGVTTDTSDTDTMTQMMQQICTSLQDLTQNQSSGGSSNMLMEMLPLMMMMRGQSSAAPVAAAPSAYPIGDGSGWIRVS